MSSLEVSILKRENENLRSRLATKVAISLAGETELAKLTKLETLVFDESGLWYYDGQDCTWNQANTLKLLTVVIDQLGLKRV